MNIQKYVRHKSYHDYRWYDKQENLKKQPYRCRTDIAKEYHRQYHHNLFQKRPTPLNKVRQTDAYPAKNEDMPSHPFQKSFVHPLVPKTNASRHSGCFFLAQNYTRYGKHPLFEKIKEWSVPQQVQNQQEQSNR